MPHTEGPEAQRGELALAGRAQRGKRDGEDTEGEQLGMRKEGSESSEGFYASHRGHGDTEGAPDGEGGHRGRADARRESTERGRAISN